MKQQPGIIENSFVSVVAFVVALPLCAFIWVTRKIVWPILRFCAKFAWKKLRETMVKSKVVKPPEPTLFTPEIFKDAPNLAPAKQVRY